MSTVADNKDRNALLRMLDLQIKISDLANEYNDLGGHVVANCLYMKGHEVYACMSLPVQYNPPKDPTNG